MKKRGLILKSVFMLCAAAVLARAAERASPLLSIDQADVVGTDALGRQLPTYAQTGGPKPNRYVGLFYWQWHGANMRSLPGNYDLTEFLKTHPKFMDFDADPVGGPKNPDFFWGQPLFGYYRSTIHG